MEQPQIKRYIRPIGEVKKIMLERSRVSRNPFEFTDHEKIERAFSALISLDRDAWVEAFAALAPPHEQDARRAEEAGDGLKAKENYLKAYNYYRIARYPTTNSQGKKKLI